MSTQDVCYRRCTAPYCARQTAVTMDRLHCTQPTLLSEWTAQFVVPIPLVFEVCWWCHIADVRIIAYVVTPSPLSAFFLTSSALCGSSFLIARNLGARPTDLSKNNVYKQEKTSIFVGGKSPITPSPLNNYHWYLRRCVILEVKCKFEPNHNWNCTLTFISCDYISGTSQRWLQVWSLKPHTPAKWSGLPLPCPLWCNITVFILLCT